MDYEKITEDLQYSLPSLSESQKKMLNSGYNNNKFRSANIINKNTRGDLEKKIEEIEQDKSTHDIIRFLNTNYHVDVMNIRNFACKITIKPQKVRNKIFNIKSTELFKPYIILKIFYINDTLINFKNELIRNKCEYAITDAKKHLIESSFLNECIISKEIVNDEELIKERYVSESLEKSAKTSLENSLWFITTSNFDKQYLDTFIEKIFKIIIDCFKKRQKIHKPDDFYIHDQSLDYEQNK